MKRVDVHSLFPVRNRTEKRERSKFSSLFSVLIRIIKSIFWLKRCSTTVVPKNLNKAHTFGKNCISQVRLEDILSGKKLSESKEFSLEEFQNYLVNVEHAPENLYFHLWLEDYSERYRRWEAARILSDMRSEAGSVKSETSSKVSDILEKASVLVRRDVQADLNQYLEMALKTFLMGKPVRCTHPYLGLELELNLTAETKDRVKSEARLSSDPSIFKAVVKEVNDMLEESMRRWLLNLSEKNITTPRS